MNPQLNAPENRRYFVAKLGLAFVLFACWGCAGHLATVETKTPFLPKTAPSEAPLDSGTRLLTAAENENPAEALADDLTAARISSDVLERSPKDELARNTYNYAVARTVQAVERADLRPWQRATKVTNAQGSFLLRSQKPVDPEHDPDRYDLIPVDTLKVGGKFFRTRRAISGIGAPLVAVARTENPQFRQHYQFRRTYAPVTAVIRFSGHKAELEFVDPMKSNQIALGKHTFPLAVDLSTPMALLIARERPERLGVSRVLDPQKYADTARLVQIQQYDPDRTPVIFVHGLQETGASWAPLVDSLRDDPVIRARYQFWFFSYPSGYPYPYSAALFRRNLDGIDRAFPNHKRVILVGHSMGGMICRLMVTDAADKIWRRYFAAPPDKTPLPDDTRKIAQELFIFRHRPEVQRAIFISTPHRGSEFASGWIGRMGAALVHTPQPFTPLYASVKPLLIADPAVRPLKRMPNSVDTLEPRDRFVQAVARLPITPGVRYHSIMGDRGRGDTPNSSDGIVPYWSSHLDGAESELIVHSDHGAQYNPEAIREVARILKEDRTASHRNR